MNRNLVTVSIVALVIGAVVGALAGGGLRALDQEDNFTLTDSGGSCTYGLKQDGYVNKGNNLKFRFHSRCGSDVTVAMGNVRTTPNTSAADCTNATNGTSWPFKSGDADFGKRQVIVPAGKEKGFVLHDATTAGSYYFSVCIANKVVDPRLVIE